MEKTILKTPLYDIHNELGGNVIDFHGVYLPVVYSSIQDEHNAVRTGAGIFDVSHMGNIILKFKTPESAQEKLNTLMANDLSKIFPGKMIYSTMLYENGTVVDDLMIMSLSDTEYHIVVNFVNIDKDYAYIRDAIGDDSVEITNASPDLAIIALQGKNAAAIMEKLDLTVKNMKFLTCKKFDFNGSSLLVSRSGYTGEDGFEIIMENDTAPSLFKTLLDKGSEYNLIPCGLGARDTLRLEAGFPLYGQELDDAHSPLQSMIKWSVKMNKESFIGKEGIQNGASRFSRKMVGFEVTGRAIPRTGMTIVNEENKVVGVVTSGTYGPTVKKNIGIAYIDPDYSESTTLQIQVRKRVVPIQLTPIPFYKRKKL